VAAHRLSEAEDEGTLIALVGMPVGAVVRGMGITTGAIDGRRTGRPDDRQKRRTSIRSEWNAPRSR